MKKFFFLFFSFVLMNNVFSQEKVSEEKKLEVNKRILQVNQIIKQRGLKWKAGITSISYLSENEFKNISNGDKDRNDVFQDQKKKENSEKDVTLGMTQLETVPDWKSYMSPVEQQAYNNCWAYAVTGVVEGKLHHSFGSNVSIDLEEMDVTDHNNCGSGRDGGTPDCGFSYIQTNKNYSQQGLNSFPNYDHAYWTISSYNVQMPTSMSYIKTKLINSPVYAAMAVYSDFQNYGGGIYAHTSGTLQGYHAVVIVGYNDEEEYWVCKNSWGSGWGEDGGYFRIKYGECEIDTRRCGSVSVSNSNCYAKVTPNMISNLSDALNYSFVSNEFAYVISGNNSLTSATNPLATNTGIIIKSGVTINTNGYSITSSGGTITIESGSTIYGAALLTGTTYNGIYSTIQAAVSSAVSGQVVEVTNTQTLTGNISIPTGITLNLKSTSVINPNGYSITSSGGTLTVQDGATLNGAVLFTGTTYTAIYATMQTALSAAVPGQTVAVNIPQTVSGAFFIVPSGITLSFGSNANVTFSSGRRISVYGNLSANGTTFHGNGTRGSWQGISFNSGSTGSIQSSTITDAQNGITFAGSSGSVQSSTITNGVIGVYMNNGTATLQGNTITNNSSSGINSSNGSNLTVTNCTISNNGSGITANTINSTITGNSILDNTNYGVNATGISIYDEWYSNTFHGNGYAMVLNNASPWIAYNTICDNTHGVVINSSLPNFCDYSEGGNNAITYSTTPLFRADNSSTVVMGYWSQGGYNSVFGSDLPDMEARNSSGIWADNTYWATMQPAVYADGTSWITTRTPLASDPNPTSCSGSSAPSSFVINSSAAKANFFTPQGDKASKYEEAIADGRSGNFQKGKDGLMTLIEGEYDRKYSPLALLAFYEFTLKERYIKNKSGLTDTLNTDLNELLAKVSKRAKGDSLRPYALRFLAREAALAHNTRGMISYNTEIITNYPNTSNELSALYDLTTHYSEIEQDFTKANEYYLRMTKAYPKEDLTLFAGINLGDHQANMRQIMRTDAEQLPTDYNLSNAFPNPFNPVTTITYQLPKSGSVTLKIYDILGNEVKTLVNEQKEMGKYTVQFDASSLASGTYVYQLRVNDYISTKKMILVK